MYMRHMKPTTPRPRSIKREVSPRTSVRWCLTLGMGITVCICTRTINTPWGRYPCCVAPQGCRASGNGYTHQYDEIVSGIDNHTKCIDDTLLWSDSIANSFHQAVQWLDVCGRNGITLNPEKFVFSSPVVDFARFTITMVLPSPKYSDAIQNFPIPHNIHNIQSWFGLVDQVSYAFSMAERMLLFRALLKAGQQFHWGTELQEIFDKLKEHIVQEIETGVRIFDKSKPTCIDRKPESASGYCRSTVVAHR